MNIVVWSGFLKRKNSTKQPTAGTTISNVSLKEATSIEKPTFVLASNDLTINYVQAFGHYYFVDDVKSVRNGIIEVSCVQDRMATYKTDVGSYDAFIERSASAYNNMLSDPFVVMENVEQVDMSGISVSDLFNKYGFFVISVLNNKGSGTGFTTYYLTDASNIQSLAAYVNTDWGSAVSQVVDWLQATFLHTADSIIDCIWLPLSLTLATASSAFGSAETVRIGIDDVTGVNGYRFQGPAVVSKSYNVTIPHRYSDFRKGAPYTTGKLFIPGYGIVDFNPLDFSSDIIYIDFDVDVATGDMVCYLKDGQSDIVAVYTYNVGVSCPVGRVGANVTETLGGVASTVGSTIAAFASSGATAAASAISATASGINTLAAAIAPTASVKGGKGGRALAENGLNFEVIITTRDTSDPNDLIAQHGRVLMEKRTISTLSGYVQCSGAAVECAALDEDKDIINGYLNGGFYYE